MADSGKYPCPSCGYLVFSGPPGTHELCPVCDWRDELLALEFPTTYAGGEGSLTLFEVQRAGAPDRPDLARDPSWRDIDMAVDDFEDFHEPGHRRAPQGDPTVLYYWRPTYWHRRQDG